MIPSAQLEPSLQVGSDKTSTSDPSPIIVLTVNGATSQYEVSIDGTRLPSGHPDGYWRGDPWAKVYVQCPTLTESMHQMTWREVWPEPRDCAPFNFSIDTTPPTAPVITTASVLPTPNALGRYAITVRGNSAPGIGVRVFVDGAFSGGAVANSVGAWTVNLGYRLTAGPHTITARTVDQAGNYSPYSEPFSVQAGTVTPPQPTVPAKVTGLTGRTSAVTLAWTAVTGATGYVVKRGSAFLANTTLLTYTDSMAPGGAAYTVAAVNAVGEGPQSDPVIM